ARVCRGRAPVWLRRSCDAPPRGCAAESPAPPAPPPARHAKGLRRAASAAALLAERTVGTSVSRAAPARSASLAAFRPAALLHLMPALRPTPMRSLASKIHRGSVEQRSHLSGARLPDQPSGS